MKDISIRKKTGTNFKKTERVEAGTTTGTARNMLSVPCRRENHDIGGPLAILTSRTIVKVSTKFQLLLNVRMGSYNHKLLVTRLTHSKETLSVISGMIGFSFFSGISDCLGIVGSISRYKYSISELKDEMCSSRGSVFTHTGLGVKKCQIF
ncbi:hypothetical protein NPIL_312361 [Nephila pilipes]|uniref:Uncharacterized protein n=1 Tax=Nephila pilipes TaxID=299642 RepID=A0A8X6NRU2_NEPPI|nr:hypothetical protein NPIL_312361 [Nephila pilipes]